MSDRVCLEIGRNMLKIAQGKSGKKLLVKKYFEVKIDNSIIVEEDDWDENVLGEIISNAFNENKIRKSNVNVVVTSISNLLIREMIVPVTDDKNMYSIIKYEAMQYFPVSLDNYIIDYKTIEIFEEEKVKKQRILVVAIRQGIVEKIIKTSKIAGININKIDIEANVLSKIIPQIPSNQEEACLIVNMEKGFITSVVVKKDMIQLAKTYPFNLEELIDNTNESMDNVTNKYLIAEIIDNISKLMNYYTSREKTSLQRIYLTGDLCNSYNIKHLLSEKTGVETLILDTIDFIENKNSINLEDICAFSITFGGLI